MLLTYWVETPTLAGRAGLCSHSICRIPRKAGVQEPHQSPMMIETA
jgi:hypothetical protein